ncbi:MAG: hypothetical protein C5B49_13100 [Bdellovibrio sp.]|nr:MAG: hypothetical protein C5B49_13100 [Bdellovibrio sp.]
MGKMRSSILFVLLSGSVLACQSPSAKDPLDALEERQNQAHPSAATIWTQTFFTSQPVSPERPSRPGEFFKHCEFVRRNPFTHRNDWSCDDP